jgi:ubiquinone biosynthesis protein UbiJ
MASPLEALLRPVADVLNRNIAEITPARAIAAELKDTTIAIRVRDTAFSAYFVFDDEVLALRSEYSEEPDVLITGSILSLARMLQGSADAAIRSGDVDMTGDAASAQRFQKLLGLVRPDVEEELSRVVGDVAAHRIAAAARGVGKWARDAGKTMGGNIREYLQEESRDVPTRYEVERFSQQVGTLRDDVERIAARLSRLESNS